MGSVIDYLKCSECGGIVFSDFDYKRGEEFLSCQSCGRHYSNEHILEEEPREDGRSYFMTDENARVITIINNFQAHGVYSFVRPGGGGVSGPIDASITLENWQDEFTFVRDGVSPWQDGTEPDMTKSHITFYDPETKEFTTVWGAKYEHEIVADGELDDINWNGPDNGEDPTPYGRFLSENASQELSERLGIPIIPAREAS